MLDTLSLASPKSLNTLDSSEANLTRQKYQMNSIDIISLKSARNSKNHYL